MSAVQTPDDTSKEDSKDSRYARVSKDVKDAKDAVFKMSQLRLLGKPIFVGLLVTFIGIWIPILFLVLIPGVGAIVAWVGFATIFVLFTSGRLFNRPDRVWRQERFRAVTMERGRFGFAIVLALLFVVIGQSLLMVTFRLIVYPREQFLAGTSNYNSLSPVMVWVVVLISALGAGIYEEIGFRGYMLQPMEKSYGFLLANTVTSIIFMLIHLNQAWAPWLLPWLFFLSFLFGIIAHVTGSIIPGMIAHVVLDIFNFGYWWSDTIGSFDYQTIWSTGVDAHFVIWSIVLTISLASRIFLFLRLIHNN